MGRSTLPIHVARRRGFSLHDARRCCLTVGQDSTREQADPKATASVYGFTVKSEFKDGAVAVTIVRVTYIFKKENKVLKYLVLLGLNIMMVVIFMTHASSRWRQLTPSPSLDIPKQHQCSVDFYGYLIFWMTRDTDIAWSIVFRLVADCCESLRFYILVSAVILKTLR